MDPHHLFVPDSSFSFGGLIFRANQQMRLGSARLRWRP
jgi:hypothetical protein